MDEFSHVEKLPQRLSPSRAQDFLTCPRLFYYKTILGLSTPPTVATIKGNLAHSVYERVFDAAPEDRNVEMALSLMPGEWSKMIDPADGRTDEVAQILEVVPPGSATEEALLADTRVLVSNWFEMERVSNFDPKALRLPSGEVVDGREVHVSADLGEVSVHGFVDRIDQWGTEPELRHAITDYKTGKLPRPQYREKYWFQLRLYAVAVQRMWGVVPDLLRLVFTTSGSREDGILVLPVDEASLRSAERQIKQVWSKINSCAEAEQWPTRTGPLCNWCYFKDVCPAWNKETDGIPFAS